MATAMTKMATTTMGTTTKMTTMATATVTAVMMMTITALAPFVASAVGWLLHCSLLPTIVVACRTLSCSHAIAEALIASSFHCLCSSSCWLVLCPPMCDIQFPHRRAATRRSHRQPPPACAIPVDSWLLRRSLPPNFIVLPLRHCAAPRRSRCQPLPICAILIDWWLLC